MEDAGGTAVHQPVPGTVGQLGEHVGVGPLPGRVVDEGEGLLRGAEVFDDHRCCVVVE